MVDGLMLKFTEAYDSMVTSQSRYSSLQSNFTIALGSVESKFDQSFQHLSQFYTILETITDSIDIKTQLFDLSLILNTSLHEMYTSFLNSKAVSLTVQCFYDKIFPL